MEDQMTLKDITPDAVADDGDIPAPEADPLFKGVVTEVVEPDKTLEIDEPEDVIHILEPRHDHAPVTLRHGGYTQTYTQKPLTYFGKMEFMSLVGKTLDEAMKGEDGLRLNTLLDTANVTELNSGDFEDLDSFLALVSKVAAYAPDFLRDCYLIWLAVPKGQRVWAREALDNLEDEEGIQIIERFIDQNWEALESFFVVQIRRLIKRVAGHRKQDSKEQL